MDKPESESPAPKVPIGNRRADYVQKMLASDHHIFTEDFPATDENVKAVIAELKAFPGCFDTGTNSFNLDKIADWVIRNLEKFRQGQMMGAPTADLGEVPIALGTEAPPADPEAKTEPVAAPPPSGGVPTARTLHAPPVPGARPPGQTTSRRAAPPPTPAPPRPQSGKTRAVGPPAPPRPRSGRTRAVGSPAPPRPQSGKTRTVPGSGAPSSGPFPAAGRPAAEKTEHRLVDLTRRTHSLTKEVARLQGEIRLYQESWRMLANTMGLHVGDDSVAEAVIEGVANLESSLEEVEEERNQLRGEVEALSSAPPQDLVSILESFPPDVIKSLGPDRVGEDIADRVKRAVKALASKGYVETKQAAKKQEDADKRFREWESVEARLREELTWMTGERDRARKERDEAEENSKKNEEKAAASLKMMEQTRQKVMKLERELAEARTAPPPAAAPGEKADTTNAEAERDRLWEVLGELVGEVAGTVKQLEEVQAAVEALKRRAPKEKESPPPPVSQPLLEEPDAVGPYAMEGEGSTDSAEDETPLPDQPADEIHAERS